MSTTANSGTHLRSRLEVVALPIDTSVASGAINAGDMVYWTSTSTPGAASLSAAGTSEANTKAFVGISQDTYPLPVAGGDSGSNAITETIANPSIVAMVEGDFLLNTTVGDTYHAFDPLYLGADAQTVTNTPGSETVVIGSVAPDQYAVGQGLGVSFAGASGQQICVRIKPQLT